MTFKRALIFLFGLEISTVFLITGLALLCVLLGLNCIWVTAWWTQFQSEVNRKAWHHFPATSAWSIGIWRCLQSLPRHAPTLGPCTARLVGSTTNSLCCIAKMPATRNTSWRWWRFEQGVSGWACPWSSPVSGSSKDSLFSKKYKAKRHGASFYTDLF